TGRLQGGCNCLGLLVEAGQDDDVRVVRRDLPRPTRDSVLVVALLDRGSHHPPQADPVASAEQRLLRAVLVEERRIQPLAVFVAEIEYVSHFDRGLKLQGAAALGAAVACERLADVGELRLVVAPRLHAPQVEPVAVRARHEFALPQRLVGENPTREPDRPERAAGGAERGADLLVASWPRALLQRRQELGFA